ncbi:hypothetical protein B0H16DRAFT_1503600 [Mycena metata]|uniref:Uncharacterized protein n=1 Tax=Mycena metata TaxID=1033252 RepID=A0AAD7K4V3_9AGAR|nr:hypothetical protein B0H16DRAFT_1503600 [Mycena metata]
MNRNYSTQRQGTSSTSGLSRNSSSNVSWGTKIRGAVQVGHGLGEAIRGSLGAADVGPHAYTSSGQIADRGRHEIAQGLARMRGVTTSLPAAPVYDRRHSYPTRQYEEQSSVWSRRSSSAHHNRENPSTASAPFQKYYEHPYPVEPEPDSGFAGLGAGIDAGRRKEGNDRPMPAFVMEPPHPSAPPSQTAYPSHQSYSAQSLYPPQTQYPSQQTYNAQNLHFQSPTASSAPSARSSVGPPLPPRNSPSVGPYYGPMGNAHLSVPPPPAPAESLSTGPSLAPPTDSRHRSFSGFRSMRFTGKGKGKGKEKHTEGNNRLGRIQSMFLPSGTQTRPASPDGDLGTEHVEPERDPRAPVRKRSISAPTNPHQHESALEHAGYDVLTYNAKDVYPSWPTEEERRAQLQTSTSRGAGGPRLEPVRSVRA